MRSFECAGVRNRGRFIFFGSRVHNHDGGEIRDPVLLGEVPILFLVVLVHLHHAQSLAEYGGNT